MNEEEAREYIEQFIGIKKEYKCKPIKVKTLNNTREAIETLLNLLEKKDKIIDLMAKELVKAHEWFYSEFDNYTKEDFIKYFENKAEEEK